MKKTVKLSESQLRKIIAESMKKVLNEGKKVSGLKYIFHFSPLKSYYLMIVT